ncbi:MAG: TetR/AcrR family transcriptional regulator [Acidimicrobiales bacterium]
MNGGQRRAAETSDDAQVRQRLLEATQRLLSKAGVEPLTSRSIADAAGANLAAITYYFGSKQQLVDEAMLAMAGTILQPVLAELESDSDAITKLLRSIQLLNQVLSDNRTAAGAYLQTVTSAATGAMIRAPLVALLHNIEQVLAREISRQQANTSLPAWIEPEAMAQLIMTTAHGTLIAASLEPDRVDHTRIASQFAQLLLNARSPTPKTGP